jgi:plasmid maintenance system antidote protein VapI
MNLYVLQEEGVEPKPLIDRLNEAEGRINGLLLDTANLAAATALSAVKYYDPSFDLQKVSEDVDLSGLVRHEDISAAAEEVVKKLAMT